MKPKIDWDFKALNPSDFEAEITMHSDNRLLLMVFEKSKQKLQKKNINVSDKQLQAVKKFDIDSRYLNLVKTFIRPVISKMHKTIKADGLEILSHRVDNGYFIRDENNNWIIKLIVEGQYADKR